MSFFRAILDKINGSKRQRQLEHEEAIREAFQARCKHFRSLLGANKKALVAMANLEDAMRGETFFNMSYVRSQCLTLVTSVFNMVRHLNSLTDNSYENLHPKLQEIQGELARLLAPRMRDTGSDLVIPLQQANYSRMYEVGGKMASLGEAAKQLGQATPPGVVVTAHGFNIFMSHNNLLEEIGRRLQIADFSVLDNVFEVAESLQRLIRDAEIPEELVEKIEQGVKDLQLPEHARFAVRSSAIGEDAHGSSFAGQFHSELNVPASQILEAYKSVVASKYCATAMTYRLNRGIPDDEMPMSVGIMAMIDAKVGGVAYSSDPLESNGAVVINSVSGLPKTIVDGSGDADVFYISREIPHTILRRDIAKKEKKILCRKGEGILEIIVPEEEALLPSLTDEQILEVTAVALGMEVFYGQPQDVEWAFDEEEQFILLQSRPLLEVGQKDRVPPYTGPEKVLAEGGVSASPGVVTGIVYKLRTEKDMLNLPENAIIVVEKAHSRWAPVLNKVAGLVAEVGGKAGHLASVSREYGIPGLFGVHGVYNALEEGMEITLDANNCRIFEGFLENLPKHIRPRTLFLGSPIHKRLGQVVPYIVPLNLVDPDASTFTPESCKTLHDITRFCHEKAVEEMFRVDTSIFAERCGKQLRYKGSALQYFVVDIENGFCTPVPGRYIDLQDICCKPMQALWDGMLAVPFVPHSATGRGFLSVVAESACNPELEVTSQSNRLMRNYFLVSREYCNLQASFGYHFCTVECQAGEHPMENFVSFHFKGGAANLSRRKLRVKAIASALTDYGFIVDVREDTLSAVAEELTARQAYKLLNILGHIVVHTRQADATLTGESSSDRFAEHLCEGIEQTIVNCAGKYEENCCC